VLSQMSFCTECYTRSSSEQKLVYFYITC
jgi:hypothetical protein